MLLGFGLFTRAGATGHVFLVNNGRRRDKGLAYSGLVGPGTTVAVVPTIQQVLAFSVDALTADRQTVNVTGSVVVTLVPPTAVATFDFTVDPQSGTYRARWEQNLHALVTERVFGPVRAKVRELALKDVVSANSVIEEAIMAKIGGDEKLSAKGIVVDSSSAPSIEPENDELTDALGAPERETMLADADAATHERQMKAVENARAVKTYESQTQLELEKERAKLVKEQNKNEMEKAKTDAKATAERLKPIKDAESGKVFAAALLEMAKSGRIGSINIAPDLLAAVNAK